MSTIVNYQQTPAFDVSTLIKHESVRRKSNEVTESKIPVVCVSGKKQPHSIEPRFQVEGERKASLPVGNNKNKGFVENLKSDDWKNSRGFHHVEYSPKNRSFMALNEGDSDSKYESLQSKDFGSSAGFSKCFEIVKCRFENFEEEKRCKLQSREDTRSRYNLFKNDSTLCSTPLMCLNLKTERELHIREGAGFNDHLKTLMPYREDRYKSDISLKPTQKGSSINFILSKGKKSFCSNWQGKGKRTIEDMKQTIQKYVTNCEKRNHEGLGILSESSVGLGYLSSIPMISAVKLKEKVVKKGRESFSEQLTF